MNQIHHRVLKSISFFFPLLFFLSGFFLTSRAQSPVFKHFSSENGLPSSTVYDLLQDSKGYLWFATNIGVSRFDGYTFQNFTIADSLSDMEILHLYEDRTGKVWFIGYNGTLSYYDYTFSKIFKYNKIEALRNKTILFILQDEQKSYWIGTTSEGIIRINPQNKVSYEYYGNSNPVSLAYMQLEDSNKLIWGACNNVPRLIYFKNNQIAGQILVPRHNRTGNTLHKGTFLEKNRFEILFAFDDTIYQIKKNANEYRLHKKYISPHNLFTISIKKDHLGNIWLGTRKGLFFFANGDMENPDPECYLNNQSITSLEEDHEGNLWVGTLEKGIYLLTRNGKHFITFDGSDELANSKVNIVSGDDKGRIYVGMQSGKVLLIENNKMEVLSDQSSFPGSKRVTEILGSHDPVLITRDDGEFLIQNKQIKQTKLKVISVRSITRSIDNYIIFSTSNTIYKTNATLDSIILKSNYPFNPEKTYSEKINVIFCDRYNNIWTGRNNGLSKEDFKSPIFLGKENPLLNERINDIAEGKNDILWISTNDKGIYAYRNKQVLTHITKKEGLWSNFCSKLYMDANNDIWICSDQGLHKIHFTDTTLQYYTIQVFNYKTGLNSNEVNDIYKTGSKVWVATNMGVTVFDESKLYPNRIPPPVYIASIKIWEKDTSLLGSYTLPYHQNNIKIKYLGLTYTTPGEVNYRYRMIGVDTGWVYSNQTVAQYPILPTGTYTFMVTAANEDGYWNPHPATIHFTIQPPFWKTWWFISLYVSCLIAILIYIIYRRDRSIQEKARFKSNLDKKIARLELDALRAQMNPHFIFNALNSIQHFLLEDKQDLAHQYLSKFAKLIRMVMDKSRKPTLPIVEELEILELYLKLESLRFDNLFQYQIEVDPRIDIQTMEIPHMLIQPYLENAIWHGLMHKADKKGMIRIHLTLKDNVIYCTIEDDGIGRVKAQEIKIQNVIQLNKSQGIKITEERLNILNNLNPESSKNNLMRMNIIDLYDEQGNAIGTKVEILIPIQEGDI